MPTRPRWQTALLCAFALGASLGSAPAQDSKWKFMVFSDSQSPDLSYAMHTNLFKELVQAVLRERPAFVMFGGDFANTPALAHWQEWTNQMAPVYAAGIPVYPVLGNHDAPDPRGFHEVFDAVIPDNGPVGELNRTYFFTHANALVLMLDTYSMIKQLQVNAPWVQAVLATNRLPHVFAMGHTPAFSSWHIDSLDAYLDLRDSFWNSLSNAQARIYFSGHDHFYDHARIDDGDGDPGNDLHQIITGTGGGSFYTDTPYDGDNSGWTPTRIYHEAANGYVTVEIDGPRVTTRWNRRIGENVFEPTAESFAYTVGAWRPKVSITGTSSNVTLRWPGGFMLEQAAAPEGPYTRLLQAISPFPINVNSARAQYYRLSPVAPN